MNQYFFKITKEERENILDKHKTVYDGYVTEYAKGGEVWDKPRPKNLGASKKLSPAKKAAAKASAKKAGRPYPNLIDNMKAS